MNDEFLKQEGQKGKTREKQRKKGGLQKTNKIINNATGKTRKKRENIGIFSRKMADN